MGLLTLDIKDNDRTTHEYMRIDFRKRSVKGKFNLVGFQDKDTLQQVLYIPSLDISAYGDTQEKTYEMVRNAMDEYFDFLTSLPKIEFYQELSKCKWKKNTFASKQFSKVYVDVDGVLQEFNAVDNKVHRLLATTA